MVDALLFELEGVLADTAALRFHALRSSLAAEHLPLSSELFADRCAGRCTRDAMRAALDAALASRDDIGIELLTARAERSFAAELAHGFALAPGARELIESAQGVTRLALVTRASRHTVDPMLALAGLEGAFECVVTADDTLDAKPDASPYRRALERLGRTRAVRAARSIALEDSVSGIRSARAAGLGALAVSAVPYVALEADACVPSLSGETVASLAELMGMSAERVS